MGDRSRRSTSRASKAARGGWSPIRTTTVAIAISCPRFATRRALGSRGTRAAAARTERPRSRPEWWSYFVPRDASASARLREIDEARAQQMLDAAHEDLRADPGGGPRPYRERFPATLAAIKTAVGEIAHGRPRARRTRSSDRSGAIGPSEGLIRQGLRAGAGRTSAAGRGDPGVRRGSLRSSRRLGKVRSGGLRRSHSLLRARG